MWRIKSENGWLFGYTYYHKEAIPLWTTSKIDAFKFHYFEFALERAIELDGVAYASTNRVKVGKKKDDKE